MEKKGRSHLRMEPESHRFMMFMGAIRCKFFTLTGALIRLKSVCFIRKMDFAATVSHHFSRSLSLDHVPLEDVTYAASQVFGLIKSRIGARLSARLVTGTIPTLVSA